MLYQWNVEPNSHELNLLLFSQVLKDNKTKVTEVVIAQLLTYIISIICASFAFISIKC